MTIPEKKPHAVLYAQRSLWAWTAWICLFGIYQSWRGIPEIQSMMADQLQGAFTMDRQGMTEIIVLTYGLMAGLSAWIVWKIGAGKNWARKSLLWGFVLQAACTFLPPYHDGIGEYLADIPDYGLQIYALYLLYTKPGSGWFGAFKPDFKYQ